MKKKIYLMALAMLCLSTFGFADQWNGTIPTADTSKYPVNDSSKGTEQSPFLIESAADLALLSANVKAGNNYQGKYFKLTTDIDLNNHEWYPIGTGGSNLSFKGNFNGDNHIISNLRIETLAHDSNDGTGLFGKYEGEGLLQNLHINSATIQISAISVNSAGALIGNCACNVTNCSVNNVSIGGGNINIGGMIGKCWANNFTNCYAVNVTLDAVSTNNRGGLIAMVGGNSANTFKNCYAAGITINGKGEALTSTYWGTLAGNVPNKATFENCYADITISGAVTTSTIIFKEKGGMPVTITNDNKTNNNLIKTSAQFANGEVAYLLDMSQDGNYPCFVSDVNPKVVKAGIAGDVQMYAKGTAVMQAPADYTYIDCTVNSDITSGQITGIAQVNNKLMYLPENVTSNWENNVIINGVCANLVLADGTDFVCPKTFEATAATYTRECYTDGGWETIVLPFGVTDIKTSGSSIKDKYTIEEYNANRSTGNTVKFTSANTWTGGKAYIIKFNENKGNNSKQTCVFSGAGTIAATPADENVKGTYTLIPHTDAKGNYILNSTGTAFNKIGETTASIPAFRAYLKGTQAGKVMQYSVIHGEGGATGIESPSASTAIYAANEAIVINSDKMQTIDIYSIDGRRVQSVIAQAGVTTIDNLAQGIYIVNNQKVIIK